MTGTFESKKTDTINDFTHDVPLGYGVTAQKVNHIPAKYWGTLFDIAKLPQYCTTCARNTEIFSTFSRFVHF